MDVAENAKPLTLDAQYIVQGNIMAIRMRFLDLARYQFAFMCRVKPDPNRIIQEDEFNHLLLIDHIWGGGGEMEFIDLNGSQTGVRFYLPCPVELSEIDEYANVIRKNFSRPRIGLWLWENLGWTPKVIELFAEELHEHRVTSLQLIEGLAVEKLGLSTYPLYPFQFPPAPQTGKSHTQPDSPLPQAGISLPEWDIPQRPVGISQIQPNDPNPPFGISQIQPGNSVRPDWTSQLQHDDPQPQPVISQNLPDIHLAQAGVDRDIPKEHPVDKSDIPLSREDQELLRLWNGGLTVKEIGLRIGKADKTVANRLSVLRGMLGEERVRLRKTPTRKDLG
ncbi:MAG: hypothetical protein PHQ40_03095 [Anaerolineaceae bacterium]|nr:hypothetical protein [Anaerolineaceae bacterium]